MAYYNRLLEARKAKGYTQEQVAEKIGVAKSTYTGYEKGNSEPDVQKMIKIMEVLEIDANYLWQDEMSNLSDMVVSLDEHALIKKYRELDLHGKKMIDTIIDLETERCEKPLIHHNEKKINYLTSTYYHQSVSAGTGNYIFDDMQPSQILIPDTPQNRKADYVISVQGDSMLPTYKDSDKLLIQSTEQINVGEIGIFIIDGESFVKEFGINRLISHNKKYSDIYLNDNQNIKCMGRVIGVL